MSAIATARFRDAIVRGLGLRFDEAREDMLARTLERRSAGDADAYLQRLERGDRSALADLAADLTVCETYFFRHSEQLAAFTERVLDEAARRVPERAIRILSAGCASGEEPYTLAMLAIERGYGARVSIRAVDITRPALARARLGRYTAWSARETSNEARERYFSQSGKELVVAPAVRTLVQFEERNLVEHDPDLWAAESYDVVFFRNVMMYFAPELIAPIIERLAGALRPGGALFLGHAETLRGISDAFELCHAHGAFYYRKRGAPTAPSVPELGEAMREPIAPPPSNDAWIDVVHTSSERVRAINDATKQPERWSEETDARDDALVLLGAERYADALDRLGDDVSRDPAIRLLRAVLLTHTGRTSEARLLSEELVTLLATSAGAHYLLALCGEERGDLDAAHEHDRRAAEIDPSFAMPRLHRGLLARRTGDLETARKELAHAAFLLRHEDAARLRLFASGLRRDALIALCEMPRGEMR